MEKTTGEDMWKAHAKRVGVGSWGKRIIEKRKKEKKGNIMKN